MTRSSSYFILLVIRPLDDQHMMCSICGRQFATPRFVVRGGQGWAHSVARPWVWSGLYRTVFELFSWFQKRSRPSVRPTRIRWQIPPRSYRFVEQQKIARSVNCAKLTWPHLRQFSTHQWNVFCLRFLSGRYTTSSEPNFKLSDRSGVLPGPTIWWACCFNLLDTKSYI